MGVYQVIILEIPHFVRNDTTPYESLGEKSGGFAAAFFSLLYSLQMPVIPNGAKRNEESHYFFDNSK